MRNWQGPDFVVEDGRALRPPPPPPPPHIELVSTVRQLQAARATISRLLHALSDDQKVVHPQAPLDLAELKWRLGEEIELAERVDRELQR